jgi:hypothetical protein
MKANTTKIASHSEEAMLLPVVVVERGGGGLVHYALTERPSVRNEKVRKRSLR